MVRRREGVGQRAVRTGRRDEHELHRHPDPQPRRIGLGEPRLHAHLARQLDVADAVGLEASAAPAYGGDFGGKHWTVQVHSVPRRPRRRSSTSSDVHAGRSPGAGTRRRRSAGTASRRAPGRRRPGDQPSPTVRAQPASTARPCRRRSPATGRPCSAPSARRRRAARPRGTSRCRSPASVRVSPRANSTSPSVAVQHVVRPAVHVAGVDEARAAPRARR